MKKTTGNKTNRIYDKTRNAMRDRVNELPLSNSQWSVVRVLIDCMNAYTGQCNPTHATLAKGTKLSRSTVKRSVCELEALGLISTTTLAGGSSNYTLHPDAEIDPAMDNRNKHNGNAANFNPNYSAPIEATPEALIQDDFQDETETKVEVVIPTKVAADNPEHPTDKVSELAKKLSGLHKTMSRDDLMELAVAVLSNQKDVDGNPIDPDDF